MTELALVAQHGEVLDQPTLVDYRERIVRGHEAIACHATEALKVAIGVGEALIGAQSLLPDGDWKEWCGANLPFHYHTAARYMRVAEFRDSLPTDRRLTLDDALNHLSAAGVTRPKGRKWIQAEVRSQIEDLHASGLDMKAIAKQVGVTWNTVKRTVDPEHARRDNERNAKRQRRLRAAERALKRQEQDRAVRSVGGGVGAIYSDIHKLTDRAGKAADDAATPEIRAAMNAALTKLHEARDEIVRALGIA